MSLQMSLIFAALCGEMITLFVLVCPIPHPVRVRMMHATEVLRTSNNFKIGVIFSTILLGMQFVDCVNRLKKFSELGNPYFGSFSTTNQQIAGSLTSGQLASKFYAQRNLYLTGAVLYLELAIWVVVGIVEKLVAKETQLRVLNSKATSDEEAEKYKELIRKKEVDIKAFKVQIEGLQRAYDSQTPDTNISKDD
ncbi:Endoplasmic reticulum transmembrane protein 1 [Meyerozyma sp. JA9]|nr:Endoplasmic reticulum transmembrane protein 1 [Meyerozyma sp. JA9]